jgi:hypothetical protein
LLVKQRGAGPYHRTWLAIDCAPPFDAATAGDGLSSPFLIAK